MYFPLEMAFAALVFSWPLKRRGQFWLRLVLSFLGCMALMMACEALFYERFDLDAVSSTVITTGSTVFWCAALFFLCVLFVWIVYVVRFREALYCGACAYLMEHLAYCARILCDLVLPEKVMEAGHWGYFLAFAGVYAAVYLLSPSGWSRTALWPPLPRNHWC